MMSESAEKSKGRNEGDEGPIFDRNKELVRKRRTLVPDKKVLAQLDETGPDRHIKPRVAKDPSTFFVELFMRAFEAGGSANGKSFFQLCRDGLKVGNYTGQRAYFRIMKRDEVVEELPKVSFNIDKLDLDGEQGRQAANSPDEPERHTSQKEPAQNQILLLAPPPKPEPEVAPEQPNQEGSREPTPEKPKKKIPAPRPTKLRTPSTQIGRNAALKNPALKAALDRERNKASMRSTPNSSKARKGRSR